uniref:Uncharacterized protein n=2 Tax=Helianthus annuus TaxID=4232 RepID=A0A2P1MA81_HELAN|nr:hypothetical protein [Helianthus annuus]
MKTDQMITSRQLVLRRSEMDALMETDWDSFPSSADSAASSAASAASSTASDARSAPLDFFQLYQEIGNECGRLLREAGMVLPPGLTMPEAIQRTFGDEAVRLLYGNNIIHFKPGFLRETYYEILINSIDSLRFQELLYLLDEFSKVAS